MKSFALISCLCLAMLSAAQPPSRVVTHDIDNFWTAYDSITTTQDTTRQLHFIRTLYIDKGSEGLKAFMDARDYTAELWVDLISRYPKFWSSIRPNTLSVKTKAPEIEQSIVRLRELYPDLKEARIYFTVGGLRSGGTTMNDMVLVGTEIATGGPGTDVSEFEDNWLAGVFQNQDADNIVALNIHEYIHTQQNGEPQDLLGLAISEGACDFITELVMGRKMQNNYIQYGRAHEKELKEAFKRDMFTSDYMQWMYNGSQAETVADLGYFMGYAICTAYYQQAENKPQAVKDIIELDYLDTLAVEHFLEKSGYYEPGTVNKAALQKDYAAKRPYVLRLEPFPNGSLEADTAVKEMRIVFSRPMNTHAYSISYGERGKESFPITGLGGYSEDGTVLTLKIALQPDHEYEFLITDRSFRSTEGYPLKPLEVKFKTR